MQWLLAVYTSRFNHRQKEFGHLFSGRYKALVVDGSGSGYLKSVCDYVHLNPVRAGLLAPEEPLANYRWSSYPVYLSKPSVRPGWLRVDRLLGEWGIPTDTPAGRAEFSRSMETRRCAKAEGDYQPTGWYHGSEEFRQEKLDQVKELAKPTHRELEVRESDQARAERLLQQELAALGWSTSDLEGRRKGDPQKLRIACRLRRETTMTLAWISARLYMGTPSHLACLLYRQTARKEENTENTLF